MICHAGTPHFSGICGNYCILSYADEQPESNDIAQSARHSPVQWPTLTL